MCLLEVLIVSISIFLQATPPVSSDNADDEPPVIIDVEELPAWTAAISAHKDGLSDVALLKLETLGLRNDLSSIDQTRIRKLLVENLVRTKRLEDALETVQGDELPFWRGIALAGLGRLTEALPLLRNFINDTANPNHENAILTIASTYKALGLPERAIAILSKSTEPQEKPILSPLPIIALAELHIAQGNHQLAIQSLQRIDTKSAVNYTVLIKLLRSRALLSLNQPKEADAILRQLSEANSQETSSSVYHAFNLMRAEALHALGDAEGEFKILQTSIENAPNVTSTLPFFERLLKMKDLKTVGIKKTLDVWIRSTNPLISRPAKFYALAFDARDIDRDIAIKTLMSLNDKDDAIATEASILIAELWIEGSEPQRALELLSVLRERTQNERTRAKIAFIEARAHQTTEDFRSAIESYRRVRDPEFAIAATFNAALIGLKTNDNSDPVSQIALLQDIPTKKLRGDLSLEHGLYLASNQDPAALETLSSFLRDYPNHPRSAEAHLAMAGINLLTFPPKAKSARQSLDSARKLPITEKDKEQVDYLAFWIEESVGGTKEALAKAENFISNWPYSSHAPSVRMRQAELCFRNKDYGDALLNFEKLYSKFPDSSLADRAMFFAAHSARLTLTEEGSARALSLWQKVAESDSPWAYRARLEQAQLKLSQGMQDEVLLLLESINNENASNELKISALILKGKALYELGGINASKLNDSIAVFDQVLGESNLSTAVRNEALFRKGKAYELQGQIIKALEAFHEVITAARSPLAPNETPELKWHYRAGFECIRLLEDRGTTQDLNAAIIIADHLAQTPGSRSKEAHAIGERLRLENFIWKD